MASFHYQVVSIDRLHHTMIQVGIAIDSPPLQASVALSSLCPRGFHNKEGKQKSSVGD